MKSKDKPVRDVQALKRLVSSLRSKIAQKDRKIERLVSDIKTLQKALDESMVYINDELSNIPVEDIVRYFKNKNKPRVSQIKKDQEQSLSELKSKWQCHKCNEGYMKLIIIERQDGKKYFRCCSSPTCKNRTEVQDWHPAVEGVK